MCDIAAMRADRQRSRLLSFGKILKISEQPNDEIHDAREVECGRKSHTVAVGHPKKTRLTLGGEHVHVPWQRAVTFPHAGMSMTLLRLLTTHHHLVRILSFCSACCSGSHLDSVSILALVSVPSINPSSATSQALLPALQRLDHPRRTSYLQLLVVCLLFHSIISFPDLAVRRVVLLPTWY